MKRSEINRAIAQAREGLRAICFALPPFAGFSPAQWAAPEAAAARAAMLGWDVTDFGSGDFARRGAVLFTLRNGAPDLSAGTPYAEKIMCFLPGQFIPFHRHIQKTEDIINRGGGILSVTLRSSSEADVVIVCDGIKRKARAGEEILLSPGESITLRPGVLHRLGAHAGGGYLVAGEVSSVNDDRRDNVFLEELPRFAKIEEDEPAQFLLCNEY